MDWWVDILYVAYIYIYIYIFVCFIQFSAVYCLILARGVHIIIVNCYVHTGWVGLFFNPSCAELLEEICLFFHFVSFSCNAIPPRGKQRPIYSIRSQCIRSKAIDRVLPGHSGLSTRRGDTLKPRQHNHHFPDRLFKSIFLNENVWMLIKVSWSLFLRSQLTMFQHWLR